MATGAKHGTGGVASSSHEALDRRERLRKLALERIDLSKDPYYFRNHLGTLECRLCLTAHPTEGGYLAHTQGKKHQTNLARRAAKDARDGRPSNVYGLNQVSVTPSAATSANTVEVRRNLVKIGRPGYRITKVRDPKSLKLGLLFEIQYPECPSRTDGQWTLMNKPRYRFMSTFEQTIEPQNRAFQYLVFAVEPYETIAFKLQSKEIEMEKGRIWDHWNEDAKTFSMQFFFK